MVNNRLLGYEGFDVGVECAKFELQVTENTSIGDGRLDFGAVADYGGVVHQFFHFVFVV